MYKEKMIQDLPVEMGKCGIDPYSNSALGLLFTDAASPPRPDPHIIANRGF